MLKAQQSWAALAILLPIYLQATGSLSTSGPLEAWPCVCEPGGLIGTQVYSGGEKHGFTQCSCPTDCAFCPPDMVLDPLHKHGDSCVCLRSLFVIISLGHLRLSNFTRNMEKTFLSYLASYLHLSSSQVILGARQNGSVILNIYFTSSSNDPNYFQTLERMLLQHNTTQKAGLKESPFGSWRVLYLKSFSSDTGASSRSDMDNQLLMVVLVLFAAITVAFLVISLVFLLYNRIMNLGPSSIEENSRSSSFRTLLSCHSTLSGKYQVYENTCYAGTAGCAGRQSFRLTSKMEPLLGTMIRQFAYSELQDAARGFGKTNLIGIGGSSLVYKGRLKDGRNVAIKRLTVDCGPTFGQEFLLEVELLLRLHHVHLIPLVGYCVESQKFGFERLLVYEYMPNGSLRELLNKNSGKKVLNWTSRLRIVLGAARGLEYLHESADPRVLHGDFKSSNILLDDRWRAKVADFGMAKVIKDVELNGCPSSPAQMLGTFGYFAPEYAMTGWASTKSDVFSFGVVLLELISGRKALDKSLPAAQESLVLWALPLLQNNMRLMTELVDPVLQHDVPVKDLFKMAYLAWLCLQFDPESRPSMTFVVQVLATLIPRTRKRMNGSEHVADSKEQMLSWIQGYSFSRDIELNSKIFLAVPDQRKLNKQVPFSDSEVEAAKHSFSLGAEYQEKKFPVTEVGNTKILSEDEAYPVNPCLESWQKNGLVVQTCSPSR